MTDVAEKSPIEEGYDFEVDTQQLREKSERRAWYVAGVACAIAFVSVVGIAMLAPYKTTVPYLYAMDKATGNVEFVGAIDDRAIKGYQELTDKFWAKEYVVARESYIWTLLQHDYESVLRLSTNEVASPFAAQFSGEKSLDKQLGSGIERRINIRSITLTPDAAGTKAVVRFERITKAATSLDVIKRDYFVVTMAYEYKPSMRGKEIDLISNPLGFKVTAYRRDSEIVSADSK